MRLYRPKRRNGKTSAVWVATWTERGHTVTRSTRMTDRVAAEMVFARWQRERADPAYCMSSVLLRAVLSRAIEELKHLGRASGTILMHERKGRHLIRIFGNVEVGRISAAAIDAYVAKRHSEGVCRGTVHKELCVLRFALRLARRRREYPFDPRDVMPPGFGPGYVPRTRVLTQSEFPRLLHELTQERAAFVRFIVATGARYSEACGVRRSDVDLAGGVVHLAGTKTALAKRDVPIVAQFREMLAGAVADAESGASSLGEKLFHRWGNCRRDLRAACARAGMPPVSPNDLRRTFATWLRRWGVAPDLIARVLGHADNRMIELVYGRLQVSDLARLIQRQLGEASTKQ